MRRFEIEHVYQLHSVDGDTYQSRLAQPSMGQIDQVEKGFFTER